MKIQISKFSPHQTAKVWAILFAISMLIFFIPFSLIALLMPGPVGPDGQPVSMGFPFGIMFIVMPIVQAILGYLVVLFGCWIYNKMYGKIGGIEFEFKETSV